MHKETCSWTRQKKTVFGRMIEGIILEPFQGMVEGIILEPFQCMI
ncbi:hypothetical protein [Deinococcus cellulosilyticus]|nr:hypothetical protein [Deinococcus cellulosilyticus]